MKYNIYKYLYGSIFIALYIDIASIKNTTTICNKQIDFNNLPN